jgi:hypothetical protein
VAGAARSDWAPAPGFTDPEGVDRDCPGEGLAVAPALEPSAGLEDIGDPPPDVVDVEAPAGPGAVDWWEPAEGDAACGTDESVLDAPLVSGAAGVGVAVVVGGAGRAPQMLAKLGATPGAGSLGFDFPGFSNRQPSTSPDCMVAVAPVLAYCHVPEVPCQ